MIFNNGDNQNRRNLPKHMSRCTMQIVMKQLTASETLNVTADFFLTYLFLSCRRRLTLPDDQINHDLKHC